MERCNYCSNRCHAGGIISLRGFIDEHKEAVESDLITSAGIEIKDVGGSLSWGAFASFVKNLNYDSALWRSVHPDLADWGTTLRTNILLADIYDVLSQINANICGGFSRKKPQRTKPYPRPWSKKGGEKRIGGKGALPSKDLHEWVKNYKPRRH